MNKRSLVLSAIALLAPIIVFAQTPAVSNKKTDTNSTAAIDQTKLKVNGFNNKGEWKPVKAAKGSKTFNGTASKKVYSGYNWKSDDQAK